MRRRWLLVVVVVMAGLLVSASASAQTTTDKKLASLVLDVLTQTTVNARDSANVDHTAHFFISGVALALVPRELNKAIVTQLTTFPLPSSSGGFAYSTDPSTGEIKLAASTFGPIFTERALTIGRKKLDFGVAFQPTNFKSFEGADLSGGQMQFFLEHNNCCPATDNAPNLPTSEGPASTQFTPAFERDLLQSQVSLDVESRTTVFYANYGLTDRLDVGVAVPIRSVTMDASVTSTILRLGSSGDALGVNRHSFDGNGLATLTRAESRSATGLGDILVRAKYNFLRKDANALAAAVDVRVPSGDKDNLLGTGGTQAKFQLITSGEYGVFAPHASVGYTLSSGDVSNLASDPGPPGGLSISVQATAIDSSLPDEVNYTFGLSAAPHPRVTVGLDVIGRSIKDVIRFDIGSQSFPNRGPAALPQPAYQTTGELLVRGNPDTGTPESLNLLLGVVGAKVNVARGLLINGGVLFPMSDAGLKPKPTPYVGLDFVF